MSVLGASPIGALPIGSASGSVTAPPILDVIGGWSISVAGPAAVPTEMNLRYPPVLGQSQIWFDFSGLLILNEQVVSAMVSNPDVLLGLTVGQSTRQGTPSSQVTVRLTRQPPAGFFVVASTSFARTITLTLPS